MWNAAFLRWGGIKGKDIRMRGKVGQKLRSGRSEHGPVARSWLVGKTAGHTQLTV